MEVLPGIYTHCSSITVENNFAAKLIFTAGRENISTMPGLPSLNDHFKIGREYKLMRNPRKMASKWFKKQSPRGLLSVAAWGDEMPASLRVVKQLVPLGPVQVQDASSASLGAAIPENEASLEGHVCARLWPESEMQEKLRGAGFYDQYVQPDGHCGVSSFLMANGHANTPENVAKLRKDVVAFANALQIGRAHV